MAPTRGWARSRFQSPEAFFERFFVLNYCPLVFMEESGRNRTPDKLPLAERKPLLEACDGALRKAVALLEPKHVIGVGVWARDVATRVAWWTRSPDLWTAVDWERWGPPLEALTFAPPAVVAVMLARPRRDLEVGEDHSAPAESG